MGGGERLSRHLRWSLVVFLLSVYIPYCASGGSTDKGGGGTLEGTDSKHAQFQPQAQVGRASSIAQAAPLLPGVPSTVLLSPTFRGYLPGRSRLLYFWKAFHLRTVNITAPSPTFKGTICLHHNTSLPPGQCLREQPGSIVGEFQGTWQDKLSPFSPHFLEVKASSWLLHPKEVTITVTEAFDGTFPSFLLLSLLLFCVAPLLSASLTFYYTSTMALSVIAVTLIVLFQLMRLMPLGGSKTLRVAFLGTMLGVGSFVAGNFNRIFGTLYARYGHALLFAAGALWVAGAGIGVWVCRRYIVPENRPDVVLMRFVEWGVVRLPALALVLWTAKNYDWVFRSLSFAAAAAAWIAISQMGKEPSREESGIAEETSAPSEGYESDEVQTPQVRTAVLPQPRTTPVGLSKSPFTPRPLGSPFTPASLRQRHFLSLVQTPKRGGPSTVPGSAREPSTALMQRAPRGGAGKPDATPEGLLSLEEFDEVARECTNEAMGDLLSTPDFKEWMALNVRRILVVPEGASSMLAADNDEDKEGWMLRRYRTMCALM